MAGSGLDGASTVQMTLFSDLLTRRFVNRQDPRTSNPHDLPSTLLMRSAMTHRYMLGPRLLVPAASGCGR